jgi:hypothetical protein
MNKKQLVVSAFVAISALFSCQSRKNYGFECYECYYGNMIVSSMTLPYNEITGKKMNQDFLDSSENDSLDYYVNSYILTTQEDVTAFYSLTDLTVDNKELTTYKTLPSDTMLLAFIFQLPNGYKFVKPKNILQQTDSSNVSLITPNFYFYNSNPELSFCYFSIQNDTTSTNTVASALFQISSSYSSILKSDTNIRFFLKEEATDSESIYNNDITSST